MTEKRNKQLNTSEKIGLIFMDLSKAIDTINLSSLAKLKACGFSEQAKFTTNSSRQQISDKHSKRFFQ